MPEWPRRSTPIALRIRSFDWSTTPLGPIEQWPQSLKTIVDLMLASPSMMSLVWGNEATHLYNDRFTELLREHSVASLGQSAFDTFARSRDAFEADLAAGMAGQSARLLAQRYPVLRNSRLEEAWFDVDYTPVRDEAGAVAGVLWSLREVTAQVLAERSLRDSEARHRLLIGSWAQAIWETDPEGVVVTDSPSWRAYTGQTPDQWIGYGWLDAIHPDDRVYAERQWRAAVAVHGLVDAEFRLRAPDGGWRWTNVRAAPVLNDEGHIVKWAGMNLDIDARKRAEAAVRESDARLAQLAGAAAVLIWETDVSGATFVNSHYLRYLGVNFAEVAGLGWANFVHPDDRTGYVEAYQKAFVARQPYDYECRLLRADGQYRWHRTSAGPAGDDRFIGSSTDIHDLKMAEQAQREAGERQQVLVAELQHRTRNVLAVVQSMADKTARVSVDLSDFRIRYRDRLDALARVQGLLSRLNDVDRVSFDELIWTEISALEGSSERVILQGPSGIRLRSSTVQTLAMALHELATNAVKYGALGQAAGRLAVTWHLVADEGIGQRRLHIDWRESGVEMPPLASTPSGGQGRELIEKALPYQLSARTTFALGPDGVHCTILIPISTT